MDRADKIAVSVVGLAVTVAYFSAPNYLGAVFLRIGSFFFASISIYNFYHFVVYVKERVKYRELPKVDPLLSPLFLSIICAAIVLMCEVILRVYVSHQTSS